MNERILVDPPDGWRYGFPAVLQEDYEVQLLQAGYPEKDVEWAIHHSRFITLRKKEIRN